MWTDLTLSDASCLRHGSQHLNPAAKECSADFQICRDKLLNAGCIILTHGMPT